MKLREIEINNMGPHEHIHAANIEELFGIIGDNGSGKSVILACVKAAMTTFWPGNEAGATFVRNSYLDVDTPQPSAEPLPENEEARKKEEARRKKELREQRKELEKVRPSNGDVRVVFTINEVTVTSYRREGKSPKVYLESSELPERLTSVSAISEYLSKLYGADLKAIAEAAFIPQGTLDTEPALPGEAGPTFGWQNSVSAEKRSRPVRRAGCPQRRAQSSTRGY
jgi:DNA repair exonuclease SbcCD ATPase subunit